MKGKSNARKVRSRKKAIFELNVIIERIISVVTVEFPTKPEDTQRVLKRINEIASERTQYGVIDYDKSTERHRELNQRDRNIAHQRQPEICRHCGALFNDEYDLEAHVKFNH